MLEYRQGTLTGLIAASFDASTLPAHWTARTTIRVTARLSGLPDMRCTEVLEQVGLPIVTALLGWIAAPAVGAWKRLRSGIG
jgi:hypothetical protein